MPRPGGALSKPHRQISEGALDARSYPQVDEGEGPGFTLIELLVVMIIIGILAAIAVPVFLSQRKKAQDSATKSDVSSLGKEIASYYVDSTTPPTVVIASGRYVVGGNDAGKVSSGVYFNGDSTKSSTTYTLVNSTWTSSSWCVSLSNDGGSKTWSYSAQNGLQSAALGTAAC